MSPAVIVNVGGQNARHPTLNIDDTQILREMEDGLGEDWWHYILVHRVRAGVWITIGPDGEVAADDLSGAAVVPLTKGGEFPVADRPFRVHGHHSASQLAGLRERARTLFAVYGEAVPTTTSADARWIFSDPSHPRFAEPVPQSLVLAAETIIRGSLGMVEETAASGSAQAQPAPRWTVMELVASADKTAWRDEKAGGTALKDKRLVKTHDQSTRPRPLFRAVASQFDTAAVPNVDLFMDSPSAMAEVADSIVGSSLEPVAFGQELIRSSGGTLRSGIGTEMVMHFYTLWCLAVVDGLDLRRLAGAEHVARRLLQQSRALGRSPKSPDFDGLGVYTRHMGECVGRIFSLKFDKYVADTMRDAAQVMKQTRLAREENALEDKNKKKKREKDED